MSNKEFIAEVVRSILSEHFEIEIQEDFWNTPLILLFEKFRLVLYLVELEQLLQIQLSQDIRLIEEVDVVLTTPADLVRFIGTQMSHDNDL